MHSKSLDIKTRIYGGDHLDVATSLMNVGNVLDDMGKYEEALVQHQKSLDIKIRVVAATTRTWRRAMETSGMLTTGKVSTSERWKTTKRLSRSSSKFPAKTTRTWPAHTKIWLWCTGVRETTYRQKRWPLRHTIYFLRS